MILQLAFPCRPVIQTAHTYKLLPCKGWTKRSSWKHNEIFLLLSKTCCVFRMHFNCIAAVMIYVPVMPYTNTSGCFSRSHQHQHIRTLTSYGKSSDVMIMMSSLGYWQVNVAAVFWPVNSQQLSLCTQFRAATTPLLFTHALTISSWLVPLWSGFNTSESVALFLAGSTLLSTTLD